MFRPTILLLLSLVLLTSGCSPLENQARDLAATSQGVIQQAQKTHLAECQANPTKPFPCVTINQAVAAQNALIDAAETYCGWPARPSVAELAASKGRTCARLQTASTALSAAVRNLNVLVKDLQGVK